MNIVPILVARDVTRQHVLGASGHDPVVADAVRAPRALRTRTLIAGGLHRAAHRVAPPAHRPARPAH